MLSLKSARGDAAAALLSSTGALEGQTTFSNGLARAATVRSAAVKVFPTRTSCGYNGTQKTRATTQTCYFLRDSESVKDLVVKLDYLPVAQDNRRAGARSIRTIVSRGNSIAQLQLSAVG